MTHTRWLCETCAREWLFAHRWQPEDGCPGCHGSAIRKVTYQPAFAGADIPRDPLATVVAPTAPRVVDAAPTPLVAQLAAAQDTMAVAQAHNALVAAHAVSRPTHDAIPEFA